MEGEKEGEKEDLRQYSDPCRSHASVRLIHHLPLIRPTYISLTQTSGYGLLSENPNFARACTENGIVFVGPTIEQLNTFGDKTKARELAIKHGVPVVPGTDGPVSTYEDAKREIEGMEVGYPVIIKAAHGGGGRGMRVVRDAGELEENFKRASSEALSAFGNGDVFIEHYVDQPRHIEVQILGDGRGNVVHLHDRDCSVQRRHQKVGR